MTAAASLAPESSADAVTTGSTLAPSSPTGVRRARPRVRETIVVYVAGEVVRSGLYTLPARSRADDALRAAGGPRAGADLVAVNLAAPLADGDEVAVTALGSGSTGRAQRRGYSARTGSRVAAQATHRHKKKRRSHRRRAAPQSSASASEATSDGPTEIVDINSADPSELEALPGIGTTLAERIVAMREASGPFASADDLLDVGGMTQGKLDAVLPFVVAR